MAASTLNPTPTTSVLLLQTEGVSKAFPIPDGELTVLEDVDLQVAPGEVVALLGRSGSGKSTLLRILAGLIPPSRGRVLANGIELSGANPGVAMVFQSFALLPWLTVQENAELGLYARGVPKGDCSEAAAHALEMVGLDGFENAYPRELSGGMRQRVGFARAFVMKPDVLMMDEPFSALDVLTAENLRGEIGDLWEAGKFPARSILIVTHNIEEAVLLADRIIVLGINPGRVRGEVRVNLPRPRRSKDARFAAIVDYIYSVMTNPKAAVGDVPTPAPKETAPPRVPMIPHARIGGISGLLELIDDHDGREDLPKLANTLRIEVDDLLPTVDAAVMLGFAEIADGDVLITPAGREFATSEPQRCKDLFREHLLANFPFVTTILETLRNKKNGRVGKEFFIDILDEHFTEGQAEEQFQTLLGWGRYAQLFDYDSDDQQVLRLEEDKVPEDV
jgi:NitT/TauT family transport system ATP-binding protein